MEIRNEDDILQVIREDRWMMDILFSVRELGLPDWWVCAGFVRGKVWDTLHGYEERTVTPDVDVVYYDAAHILESEEKQLEAKLHKLLPGVPWSVKNEARMHMLNDLPPYSSAEDAISKFPETATSLGVRLNEKDSLVLTAPHGIDDLVNFIVRPTPLFEPNQPLSATFEARILKKNWQLIWDKVTIHRAAMI
ncbi:nucleotidyltransferase family protein [Paenibacillus solisilvae]|uniref:Nucleotidyltransferase family protein n=1 Tax=Paenibacillus solisilvae TaxID=2486751 RepID=A0ABW0W542_9BACL